MGRGRLWFLAWALPVLVVAWVLAACGSSTPPSDGPADASTPDDAPATGTPGPDATTPVDSSSPTPGTDGSSPLEDAPSGADALPPNYAPSPVLVSIAPSTAVVGAAGPTLVCTGLDFVARSVVQVGGVALATSFVSSTELRATLPSAKLATVGTLSVTVGTAPPGGGGSGEVPFEVVNPTPTVTGLTPTSVPVGSTATPLTVTGTGFQSTSTLSLGGTSLPATFVSATTLTATIPAASLATAGSYPVVVTDPAPGGGPSQGLAFIVSNPNVSVTSVTPSAIAYGSGDTTLALVGSGFVSASAVSFNGTSIATTYKDAQHLSATVPASALLSAGAFPVVVTNPAPGGGVSAPVNVSVTYPAPVASSLSPASVVLGAPPPTVTVTGSGFLPGVTTIAFNGTATTTIVADASHASATLTTQLVAAAGAVLVTVTNPKPGGGTSSALSFTVDEPAPVATSVSPSSALVGASATPITVSGSSFVAGSVITLGATALATTFVDAQTLTATIPASALDSAATLSIAVTTAGPGGGTSQALSFVVDNPGPTITAITPSSIVVPAVGTAITVSGTGFVAGVSTVAINGTSVATTESSGALAATIPSGSLQAAGTLSITVVNPAPGGGTSNVVFFTADDPAPVLSSVTPPSIAFGSSATSIALVGSGFVAASQVMANGTAITSTFVDADDLTATIPASMLLGGSVTITVVNPAPGGGTSAGQTITVPCNTTGADVVLSSLQKPTSLTPNLASVTATLHRIAVSQSTNGYKCPATADTSNTNDPSTDEPYVAYLVVNDTSSQVTLDAWAVCNSSDDDEFLALYATSTKPTTQAQLEACATDVAEGQSGSAPTSGDGFAAPSADDPGGSDFCPGLTKANGGGLTLAACGEAVVVVQAYSLNNSSYTPPPTLQVQIE